MKAKCDRGLSIGGESEFTCMSWLSCRLAVMVAALALAWFRLSSSSWLSSKLPCTVLTVYSLCTSFSCDCEPVKTLLQVFENPLESQRRRDATFWLPAVMSNICWL